MKRFDEKFKKHIKDVFEDYNADHLADEGWNAFLKKKQKSKRFYFFSTIWAKAATIAILVSVGGFFTYKLINSEEEPLRLITEKEDVEEQILPKTEVEDYLESIAPIEEKIAPPQEQQFAESEPKYTEKAKKTDVSEIEKARFYDPKETEKPFEFQIETKNLIAVNNVNNIEPSEIKRPDLKIFRTSKIHSEKSAAPVQVEIKHLNEVTTREKTKIGFHLSGIMAMVENNVSSTPGAAIGLFTEYRLTDRLRARPGLTLANHSYHFYGGNYAMDNIARTETTYDLAKTIITSQETQIDLVSIEIPLNFVFDIFKTQRQSIYVSAGTSTIVYLDQHFTGHYNINHYDENDAKSYNPLFVEEHYGAFSKIDPFGLINIAAGYSFSSRRNNNIVVEPFVQLPASKLTSINLHMHFGGIKVQYQIQN